jgi:dolichol kinase
MFLNLLVVLFVYAVIIGSAEVFYRLKFDSFLVRKVAHTTCGVLTAFLPSFLDLQFTVIAGLLLCIFVVISKKWKLFKGVEDNHRSSWGTLYFPIGFVLCALAFWNVNTLIFSGATLVLGFADAGAAIFGKRFGVRKYANNTKTYLGSLFFVFITMIIVTGVYNQYHAGLAGFGFARVVIVIVGSVLTAFVESLFSKGEDNIYIPMVAGILIYFIL